MIGALCFVIFLTATPIGIVGAMLRHRRKMREMELRHQIETQKLNDDFLKGNR
jgi:hypothetical protein